MPHHLDSSRKYKFAENSWSYTNADLKILSYVCVQIKTIQWKFCILSPKNSRVIHP